VSENLKTRAKLLPLTAPHPRTLKTENLPPLPNTSPAAHKQTAPLLLSSDDSCSQSAFVSQFWPIEFRRIPHRKGLRLRFTPST
jgi:hypothetical protein